MDETKIMIGLEVHAYLGTKSKLFCSCSAGATNIPNSQVCPICLGHPGSKPVLNEAVVALGTKVGLALKCKINEEFFFSRKTYFYPDMCMNYQITQYEIPICGAGELILPSGKKVRIRRAHIEWDPAALIHPNGMGKSNYVLIDYNRSGLPLIEIVTEPDLESPAEARGFMNTLENILNYLQVLRPNTTLKADCNISINGGNRVEIKNVSGFAAAEKALSYELLRQKNEVKMGRKIEQHTRAFDANSGITNELRKKETEDDYGYIFDPDLVKVSLSSEFIESIKSEMPELPEEKAQRLKKEFNLSDYDAKVLCGDYNLGKLFDELVKEKINPVISARLLTRELLSILNHDSILITQAKILPTDLVELVKLIQNEKVSDKNVKQAMINYISGNKSSPKDYLEKNNLLISVSIDLDSIVEKIILSNQKAADDYKAGNEKSLNFLSGLIMRETRGAVSPSKVLDVLKQKLSK